MTNLVVKVSTLAFLLDCLKFIWKVEQDKKKKKPSTTRNRRRHN